MALEHGSLTDTAYLRIRKMIIRGEMAPGHRFTEVALARSLSLGKTPVREALGRLAQEGFVRSIPRVGYAVAPITLRDIAQVLDFRLIVEPASVRMAAGRLTIDQEAELREIVRMETVDASDVPDLTEERIDEQMDANRRFHVVLARASQNDRLIRAVESALDEGDRFSRMVIRDLLTTTGHHEILEATVAGEADLAEQAARAHVADIRERVLRAYLASSSVQEAELTPTTRQAD